MYRRFAHIAAVTLVFGSMWLHGGIFFFEGDHQMNPISCLESCLDALNVGTSDHGLLTPSMDSSLPDSEWTRVMTMGGQAGSLVVRESHHDPGRILTTIKRE